MGNVFGFSVISDLIQDHFSESFYPVTLIQKITQCMVNPSLHLKNHTYISLCHKLYSPQKLKANFGSNLSGSDKLSYFFLKLQSPYLLC